MDAVTLTEEVFQTKFQDPRRFAIKEEAPFSEILFEYLFATPEGKNQLQGLICNHRNSAREIVQDFQTLPPDILQSCIQNCLWEMVKQDALKKNPDETLSKLKNLFSPLLKGSIKDIQTKQLPQIILSPKIQDYFSEEIQKLQPYIELIFQYREEIKNQSSFFEFYDQFRESFEKKDSNGTYSFLKKLVQESKGIIPNGKESYFGFLFFIPEKHRKILEDVLYVQHITPEFKRLLKSEETLPTDLKNLFFEYVQLVACTKKFGEYGLGENNNIRTPDKPFVHSIYFDSTPQDFEKDVMRRNEVLEEILKFPVENIQHITGLYSKVATKHNRKLSLYLKNSEIYCLDYILKNLNTKTSKLGADLLRVAMKDINFMLREMKSLKNKKKVIKITQSPPELITDSEIIMKLSESEEELEILHSAIINWLQKNNPHLYNLWYVSEEKTRGKFIHPDFYHWFGGMNNMHQLPKITLALRETLS